MTQNTDDLPALHDGGLAGTILKDEDACTFTIGTVLPTALALKNPIAAQRALRLRMK